MSLTLDRTCWWCGNKLMAISHAEVENPDGQVVWVHKTCEPNTRNFFKIMTAQPPETPNPTPAMDSMMEGRDAVRRK